MIRVSMDEIQRDWPSYLERLAGGETVILLEENIPVAEIKPLPNAGKKLRPFGLAAGQFTVPDDFDAPLPEEILREFEGG